MQYHHPETNLPCDPFEYEIRIQSLKYYMIAILVSLDTNFPNDRHQGLMLKKQ